MFLDLGGFLIVGAGIFIRRNLFRGYVIDYCRGILAIVQTVVLARTHIILNQTDVCSLCSFISLDWELYPT